MVEFDVMKGLEHSLAFCSVIMIFLVAYDYRLVALEDRFRILIFFLAVYVSRRMSEKVVEISPGLGGPGR